jgi:uncharacterized coiled-coil protein SlyX
LAVPNPKLSPYHIGEQRGIALLGPVEATLAELEARLAHFVDRINLSDADRSAVAEARSVVGQAHARLAALATAAREADRRRTASE